MTLASPAGDMVFSDRSATEHTEHTPLCTGFYVKLEISLLFPSKEYLLRVMLVCRTRQI